MHGRRSDHSRLVSFRHNYRILVNVIIIIVIILFFSLHIDNMSVTSSDDDMAYHIAFSDSDEEDEIKPLPDNVLKIIYLYATIIEGERRPFITVRDRITWDKHVDNLLMEGAFNRMYRMSNASFNKLCMLLDPFLSVDPVMSMLTTNQPKISTEIILSCFIRWVAGGSYLDIRTVAGISIASFYRVMGRCAKAILHTEALAYHFPKTQEELQSAAAGFRSISTNNFLTGFVGVMDGLLLRIRVPAAGEVGHVTSFFSGHYQAYGINVQAACDHQCRFI
jgi:hypothetical protein